MRGAFWGERLHEQRRNNVLGGLGLDSCEILERSEEAPPAWLKEQHRVKSTIVSDRHGNFNLSVRLITMRTENVPARVLVEPIRELSRAIVVKS